MIIYIEFWISGRKFDNSSLTMKKEDNFVMEGI